MSLVLAVHYRAGSGRWKYVGAVGSWEEAQRLVTREGSWRVTRVSPSPVDEAKKLLRRFRKVLRRDL